MNIEADAQDDDIEKFAEPTFPNRKLAVSAFDELIDLEAQDADVANIAEPILPNRKLAVKDDDAQEAEVAYTAELMLPNKKLAVSAFDEVIAYDAEVEEIEVIDDDAHDDDKLNKD